MNSILIEEIKAARREVRTWSDDRRAMVQLEGPSDERQNTELKGKRVDTHDKHRHTGEVYLKSSG